MEDDVIGVTDEGWWIMEMTRSITPPYRRCSITPMHTTQRYGGQQQSFRRTPVQNGIGSDPSETEVPRQYDVRWLTTPNVGGYKFKGCNILSVHGNNHPQRYLVPTTTTVPKIRNWGRSMLFNTCSSNIFSIKCSLPHTITPIILSLHDWAKICAFICKAPLPHLKFTLLRISVLWLLVFSLFYCSPPI